MSQLLVVGGRNRRFWPVVVIFAIIIVAGTVVWGAYRSPHRSDLSTFGAFAVAVVTLAASLIVYVAKLRQPRDPGGGRTLWTVVNRNEFDVSEDVISVAHVSGRRYYDLWSGVEVTPRIEGDRAVIRADTYGGREFQGVVNSIAGSTGSEQALLPPQNATGNFVKVVQRVPVKILVQQSPKSGAVLRPGMNAEVTIYVR